MGYFIKPFSAFTEPFRILKKTGRQLTIKEMWILASRDPAYLGINVSLVLLLIVMIATK